ncbi:uncharacterized protein LOC124886543 [Capsicum annuum]|uniref:uncharacterized protein LOC124886543 n=1 Tax=Capsicum annuum TaxID=4072 RepID=UPI001FB08CCA|nr:uncharacterized protein LOC124886543 [Capsicum annuum]
MKFKAFAERQSGCKLKALRLPTKAIDGKTPIEAWSGKRPSTKNLKIFLSKYYSHVPSVRGSKLEPKGELGIFIGYSLQAKGYRVFNLETKGKLNLNPLSETQLFGFENLEEAKESDDESSLDSPILKTRSLSDIYERCNVAILEPNTYQEISKYDVLIEAMKEEIGMIEKNDTWKLVDKPKDRNVIGVKWVYRTKLNPDGSVNKHKARLVVKGYALVVGLDYGDKLVPVARHNTIRLLLSLAAHSNWKLYNLNVKSAFLNGPLQEQIYVDQSEATRPDLMFVESFLSRFMHSPSEVHHRIAKRTLRKQDVVSQSSAEAEYIAIASATNQALWQAEKDGEVNPVHCSSDQQIPDI